MVTEPVTVSANANSAGNVAPTLPIVAPPVVQTPPDDDLPKPKAYSRMDTRV